MMGESMWESFRAALTGESAPVMDTGPEHDRLPAEDLPALALISSRDF